MSKETHSPAKSLTIQQAKDKLKDLITNDINQLTDSIEVVKNTTDDILQELLKSIGIIDFQILAFPESENLQKEYVKLKTELFGDTPIYLDNQSNEYKEAFKQWQKVGKELSKCKLTKNHYLIICIEQLLKIAIANKWGLCRKNGFIYLYNGAYWSEIDKERFQSFLGNVALKMGVEKYKAKIHTFKEDLFKQFMAESYLPTPNTKKDCVLINLQNGTFEITPNKRGLRNLAASYKLCKLKSYSEKFELN